MRNVPALSLFNFIYKYIWNFESTFPQRERRGTSHHFCKSCITLLWLYKTKASHTYVYQSFIIIVRGILVSFISENSNSNNMATLYITIECCRGSSMNTPRLFVAHSSRERSFTWTKRENAFMIVVREKLFSRADMSLIINKRVLMGRRYQEDRTSTRLCPIIINTDSMRSILCDAL